MGNIFAKDPSQLNFNGVRTENFSDNIPYLNKLQTDSRILANHLNTVDNTVDNKKMYEMFNAQESDNNFSDTSPLVDTNDLNNSATSVANSEIKELLSKIQKGGSLEQINNNEPVNFISNDIIQQLLTETSKNQTGGNLEQVFINEDMLKNLMTESNEQSGGFFWNKKDTPKNETFINEETFKSLIENNTNPNTNPDATSEPNTEFNNYINNAVTELTSTLEGNSQKGGGERETTEDSSSSESPQEKMINEDMSDEMGKEMNLAEMDRAEMGENVVSTGRNTYSSSSAHSDGIDSNNSNMSSTISESKDKYLSDSINTSDINMISVE